MDEMTLEQALQAASVDDVQSADEVLLIDPETRRITIPESEKLFGVRQDKDVERKRFRCPKVVGDNVDLSKHVIMISYVPSKEDGSFDPTLKPGGYWCDNVQVEGDYVTFSWVLSDNVFEKAGYIAFAVYAKSMDMYGNEKTKWHTTTAVGKILDTLPDGDYIVDSNPDLITQLLEKMSRTEEIVANANAAAELARTKAQEASVAAERANTAAEACKKSGTRFYMMSEAGGYHLYEIPNTTPISKIKDGTIFTECLGAGLYKTELLNLSAIENLSSTDNKVFYLSGVNKDTLFVGEIDTMFENISSDIAFNITCCNGSFGVSSLYPLEDEQ